MNSDNHELKYLLEHVISSLEKLPRKILNELEKRTVYKPGYQIMMTVIGAILISVPLMLLHSWLD